MLLCVWQWLHLALFFAWPDWGSAIKLFHSFASFHFLVTSSRCICLLQSVSPAPVCFISPGLSVFHCRCFTPPPPLFFFPVWIIIKINASFPEQAQSCSVWRLFCSSQKPPFPCPNHVATLPYFLNLVNFLWNIIIQTISLFFHYTE